ncbi:MAG: ribonucleotide reductase N-terminal alpha domain-containing protein [Planctomycetota bacterium]|jgi:ribonucleoside-diphosphate reductase alpha chain
MAKFHIHPPPGDAPVLSGNALKVLQSRYLIKDVQGNCIETPAQLFSRVASSVAQAEAKYGANRAEVKRWHKKFYDLMASLEFLPNSPALMNAQRRGMLSACFVLPIEDSIEGIFEAVKQTALIQQAGGGTGFSFDKLRPTGDRVASSGGTTSGPISFWRVFSETTNAIQQGAFRRGANMGMMSVEHPDILRFLHASRTWRPSRTSMFRSRSPTTG